MKELSVEEKAKRYDEAIEKFDVILHLNTVKESGTIFADDVRKILPELKESEDEKIRKELISHFVGLRDNVSKEWYGIKVNDIIAWLEKQGKSKFEQCIQEGDKIVSNEDGTRFNVNQLERVAKKVTESKETAKEFLKSAEIMDGNDELSDEYRFEKQGEPQWKPSEEHIRYLQAVVNDVNNIGSESCYTALRDLLGQLKSL